MIAQLIHLLNQLDLPEATWVGPRGTQETQMARSLRDGHPEQNGTTISQGIMVEVLVRGQMGYAATQNLHPDSVKATAERAYQAAITASLWKLTPTSPTVRPRMVGEYSSPYEASFNKLTPAKSTTSSAKSADASKPPTKLSKSAQASCSPKPRPGLLAAMAPRSTNASTGSAQTLPPRPS